MVRVKINIPTYLSGDRRTKNLEKTVSSMLDYFSLKIVCVSFFGWFRRGVRAPGPMAKRRQGPSCDRVASSDSIVFGRTGRPSLPGRQRKRGQPNVEAQGQY